MTEPAHTLGPWGLRGDAVCRRQAFGEVAPGITIGSPHNTEPICRVSGYCQPLEANASLIASAPDLLAACIHVLGCIENKDGDMERVVRAAVARATQRLPSNDDVELATLKRIILGERT